VSVVADAFANGDAVDVGSCDVATPDGIPGGGCVDVPLDEVETHSLVSMEMDILNNLQCPSSWGDFSELDDPSLSPTAFGVSSSFSFHRPFDLTKFPLSYSEAIAHSDAPVWRAAMNRERKSLDEMGAFEES
jgi:hypothetical protein